MWNGHEQASTRFLVTILHILSVFKSSYTHGYDRFPPTILSTHTQHNEKCRFSMSNDGGKVVVLNDYAIISAQRPRFTLILVISLHTLGQHAAEWRKRVVYQCDACARASRTATDNQRSPCCASVVKHPTPPWCQIVRTITTRARSNSPDSTFG